MKPIQLIMLVCCSMIGTLLLAQTNEENEISNRTKDGWYIYTDEETNSDRDYTSFGRWNNFAGFFDITHNDWTGDLKPFKMQGPSIGFNVGILHSYPILANNKFAIAFGIAYGKHRMKHDLEINYDSDTRITTVSSQDSFVVGSRKLISGQWSIPVELRFQTNTKHGFYCHIGGKLGYQSRLYEKGRTNGSKYKHKHKFESDKQPWVYSVHARMGFRYGPSLYASYNFNSLFRNSKSTQLNLIEMGLSFAW